MARVGVVGHLGHHCSPSAGTAPWHAGGRMPSWGSAVQKGGGGAGRAPLSRLRWLCL
jgi:hypothetical protein